jgi:hypothetical protein
VTFCFVMKNSDNCYEIFTLGKWGVTLVDLDLSKDIFYEVMVEREGFAFPIAIEYEDLPEFCTHCKCIRHNVTSCRWLHPRRENNVEQPIDKDKKPVHSQRPKQWWKPKDNPEGVGSSKAFAKAAPIQQDDISNDNVAFGIEATVQQIDGGDDTLRLDAS